MQYYRQKNVTHPAVQWLGHNQTEILNFVGEQYLFTYGHDQLLIRFEENEILVNVGDWVVNISGYLTTMTEAEFKRAFEPEPRLGTAGSLSPTDFPERNLLLGKPAEWTDEQCLDLPVWLGEDTDGMHSMVSCWEITPEEADQIQKTRKIWLKVCGGTHPPVAIFTQDPFVHPQPEPIFQVGDWIKHKRRDPEDPEYFVYEVRQGEYFLRTAEELATSSGGAPLTFDRQDQFEKVG